MCSQADGSNGGRVVDPRLIGSCSQRMRLQPKRAGLDGRINAGLLPPIGLVPAAVHFTMMTSAQRHGEFVADFASEGGVLRKPQVMGVARPPAANQAKLLRNRFDVLGETLTLVQIAGIALVIVALIGATFRRPRAN